MTIPSLASCSLLLVLVHAVYGWSTARIITEIAAANPSPGKPSTMLAFFAPPAVNHLGPHHRPPLRQPSPPAPSRATTRESPRGRTVLACLGGAPVNEEQREGRNGVGSRSSHQNINLSSLAVAVGTLTGAVFPAGAWAAAAGAAAVAEIVGDAGGSEMGARLDAPAAISFGAVVAAFAFLQARIRTAVRARTARRDYEVLFKGMKARQLAGQADEDEVALVEERMSQLLREEQEARMVDIFGIPFNLVIPDGGAGGEQGTGTREAQQGRSSSTNAFTGGGDGESSPGGVGRGGQQQQQQQLGIREARKAKAESDLRDGRAREEEMSPGATLKVAALWLVLVSQLWLLVVLWNDPMGPASSAFLKD